MNPQTSPPARGIVPPLDPQVKAAIQSAILRNPRDLSLNDALTRLHGHLGLDHTVFITAFVDNVTSGAFGAIPAAGGAPLDSAGEVNDGSSAAAAPAPIARYQHALRAGRSASSLSQKGVQQRVSGSALLSRSAPLSRPQTRSQTAEGAARTRRPASAAPNPHLRARTAVSKPYQGPPTPAPSEPPSTRAAYTSVIPSDLAALAKFRLEYRTEEHGAGGIRKNWRRFLSEFAPRLQDRPRFWQEADRYHDEKILKLVAKLEAATTREDSVPVRRNPLRTAAPDTQRTDATSRARVALIREDTPEVTHGPGGLRHATPDTELHPDAADEPQVKLEPRPLMDFDALEVQLDVQREAQWLMDEDDRDIKPDIKPEVKPEVQREAQWLMDEDDRDIKPDIKLEVKPEAQSEAQSLVDEEKIDAKPDGQSLPVLGGVEEGATDSEKLEE